jgi:hypothetical protein
MNDISKERLSALNELVIQALRALFDEEIEKQRPEILDSSQSAMDTNEGLGEKYRAYLVSQKIIDGAFQELITLNIRKSNNKGFAKEL